MKKSVLLFCCLATLLIGKGQKKGQPDKRSSLSSFEVAAYLPYWGLASYQQYQYDKITSLYLIATITRATVHEKKGLLWNDKDTLIDKYIQPDLNEMCRYIRNANPKIKIILALSDLHNTDIERKETSLLFNNENREATVTYLMDEYVDKYDLDGIDVDFEDQSLDAGYIYMNYPLFIRDLATALHNEKQRGRRKLCTATLFNEDYNRPVITTDFKNNVDLVGVQDYGSEKMDYLIANPHRNLKKAATDWSKILSASKLAFGLAAWSIYVDSLGNYADGYAFNYNDQLRVRPEALYYIPYLTTDSFVAITKPSGYQQRYNGLYETRRKAEYILQNGYRGVFMWDLSKDAMQSGIEKYSYLSMLHHWLKHPQLYKKITGYTTQDYYSSQQNIEGGYHSLDSKSKLRAGIFELSSGAFSGYSVELPATVSGLFSFSATITSQLKAGTLYIIKFYTVSKNVKKIIVGTSHPFLKS